MSVELRVGGFRVPLPGETVQPRDLIQTQNDFKRVFECQEGAEVLSYLMRVCFYGNPTHVIDDPGGRHSAFQEGQRHMINSILAFLTRSPEEIKRFVEAMQKEQDENG